MNELKRDMARIQTLVGDAFNQTGGLVALSDGGQMALKSCSGPWSRPWITLNAPPWSCAACARPIRPVPAAISARRPPLQSMQPDTWNSSDMAGSTSYSAHCCPIAAIRPRPGSAIPSPACSTIMKGPGCKLPYFQRAMLVIDEHSSTEGRHIYDSDNKGWKAVSNALKGRLFPDDDQYTLALSLLSTRSTENVCHITLLDLADAADFFALFTRGIIGTATSIPAGGPPNRYPADFPSKTPFARG